MEKETTNGFPETDLNKFDVIFERVEPTPIINNMNQKKKIFKMK